MSTARTKLGGMAFLLLAVAAVAGGSAGAARAETVAVVGGTVYTMGAAGTIENATVLFDNGRIKAVGKNVAIPPGARTVDAKGKFVTPGLFDSMTGLGIVEVGAVAGTRDGTVQNDRITAALDVADALNPRSVLLSVNRVEGLTRAVVAPGNGKSLIAGRGAVIHLGIGSATELLVRSPAGMFATLGEAGAHLAGGSRAAAMLQLKEALDDALDYASHRDAWEKNNRRSYALSRLDLEALAPVAKGELPLVLHVHRASDIEAALRLGRERKVKLILADVEEGWVVADQIAAAKVPVLLNPMDNLPANFEQLESTLENAARLFRAGVTFAFMTGDAHNARNLRQLAGNAAAYGLPWTEALRAMTINPARIWRLDDRLGTLEPGKDADVVIWDGDPLELTTAAEKVFIRGAEMPTRTRQTELRDRYLKLGGPLPPAYQRP